MRRVIAIAASAALATAGCGGAIENHSSGCEKTPQSIPTRAIVEGGTSVTIPRGGLIYVVLIEGPEYGPQFPWGAVRSSNHGVLTPVALCPRSVSSSLATTVSAFRATAPGSATLTAPLVAYYRTRKTGLRTYEA